MNSCDFRRFSPPNLPRSTSFPHFTKRHMTPSGLPSVQRWQWWVLLPSQNLWGSLKTHKLINCPTHTNPAPLLSPCPANNSKHSHSPSFNRPRHKPVFTVAGVDAPLLPVGFANLSGVVPDLMPRLERRWWSWWKKWGQYLYHPVPVYSLDSSWHGQSRAKMPWQSEIIQDHSRSINPPKSQNGIIGAAFLAASFKTGGTFYSTDPFAPERWRSLGWPHLSLFRVLTSWTAMACIMGYLST